MKVSKAVRRSREDDDDDEDFVIGESESSRQGHGGGGSMRSVASGLGPVVTDRAANFTMLVPGAGAPRHASYNYDPHNGNPFEDQHGPASIIPPSMAMAASRTAYRQPQPQPGQQFADPRQQEYLYPQQVSNYSPQPHPYAGQEHAPYQGQPQAHYNIDAYEDHQAYATSYSNHSYPELPPSSTARSSEDEFYQRGPLKVSPPDKVHAFANRIARCPISNGWHCCIPLSFALTFSSSGAELLLDPRFATCFCITGICRPFFSIAQRPLIPLISIIRSEKRKDWKLHRLVYFRPSKSEHRIRRDRRMVAKITIP